MATPEKKSTLAIKQDLKTIEKKAATPAMKKLIRDHTQAVLDKKQKAISS